MFGRIQCHVIREPRARLQGAATWWIHCHDSTATCHIARWNNSIRRSSPYFIFFLFLLQCVGFGERRLSYRLQYTCLTLKIDIVSWKTRLGSVEVIWTWQWHRPLDRSHTSSYRLPFLIVSMAVPCTRFPNIARHWSKDANFSYPFH